MPARFGLAAALVLAVPIVSAALAQEPDPGRAAWLMDDLMWGRGHVGGPFTLLDHTGTERTDRDFLGKLLIIYFGYTTCPDICPTALMQIGMAVDKLGPAGENVQPIFISVDPERDTTSVLAKYVVMFHPRLVGLTGTPEQIRAVADSYKAYYAKYTPSDGAVYLIDHTGFIYLVGPDGRYRGVMPPGTSADRIVEIVRQLLPQH
jgi:cytochrome oxidase Cu insertion factor (SCO1/SenC/PrrC family)